MNDVPLRELVPAVIGVLVRRGADFASAEDAVQEALVRALAVWPEDPPRDPKGWLITVAWHRFLDDVRSQSARRTREDAVYTQPASGPVPDADDTLALYVLPVRAPGPRGPVGGRADAARGRGPDDGADRERLPGSRADDRAANQPRQAPPGRGVAR